MNETKLWEELHDLFDTDDGSLPEIALTDLTRTQIGKIFFFLFSSGKDGTTHGGVFWDKELNLQRSIRDVENAAILVASYEAAPFHIVIRGMKHNSSIIPDLGIFVFQSSIFLDYRKGPEWESAKLEALFYYLYRIYQLAPDVKVGLQASEPEVLRKKFQNVWENYTRECEV
jgi:hypothetical protein